jgi:hypothetical protein
MHELFSLNSRLSYLASLSLAVPLFLFFTDRTSCDKVRLNCFEN